MFEGRRRLAGLGDAGSTSVQVDTSDVLNLGDSLRNAQNRLTAIVAQMRQDADLARAIGPSVTSQQAALGDLTAKYVGVYTAIFGQPPAGLGNPVLIAAAVAVILAYVTAQLYLSQQKQAAAQAAAAAGDAAGAADANAAAQAMLLQAGIPGAGAPPPPPPPQNFADWIKANWLPVAAVGAAIVFVPRMMGR